MSSALNNTLQIHQVSSGLKSLPRRSMRPQARASFKVSAVLQNRPPRQEGDILQTIAKESDKFFQRYDCLSTGMGALACTSFCVYRGQDPWDALMITASATIAALVINEMFFKPKY